MNNPQALTSSFRDPGGFMFEDDGVLYRQINHSCRSDYERLMTSGLYDTLTGRGLLISHQEVVDHKLGENSWRIIRPQRIAYISYPYEWSFSQLKDAALCTMTVQQLALENKMVLKDASAYNIQFHQGCPILIDTLSFTQYEPGRPWEAYKQFCQHFLGPLALMAHTDVRLSQLFRIYMDGAPLDLVSKLLPKKTWLTYAMLSHLHLHARTQARYSDIAGSDASGLAVRPRPISELAFHALMKSIENAVNNLDWGLTGSEWGDYYADTNYADEAMQQKETVIRDFINGLEERPQLIQDLGANNGHFSRIAAETGIQVVSQDVDPVAVEKNYRHGKAQQERSILPLVLDLTNPSGDLGWQLQERESFFKRCQGALVMALALIHHLAISNNVPLDKIAEFFSSVSCHLIIEFVPKQDSQVQRLLTTREDIFPDYTPEKFEAEFSRFFTISKKVSITKSSRTLYLLKKRD